MTRQCWICTYCSFSLSGCTPVINQQINILSTNFGYVVGNFTEVGHNQAIFTEKFRGFLNSSECIQHTTSTEPLTRKLENQQSDESVLSNTNDALDSVGLQNPLATPDVECLLNFTSDSSKRTKQRSENLIPEKWELSLFFVPCMITAALLMVGVAHVWHGFKNDYQWVLDYILLPIFSIQVCVAYTYSSLILFVAGANADFCSGGDQHTPDATITDIVTIITEQTDLCRPDEALFVQKVLQNYIGHCRQGGGSDGINPSFDFVNEFQLKVEVAKQSIVSLSKVVAPQVGVADNDFCDTEFQSLSASLLSHYEQLNDLATEALDLVSCERIVPLYQEPIHAGMCNLSISGITWAFTSLLVIAVAGLIMIMLRSSWQGDQVNGAHFVVAHSNAGANIVGGVANNAMSPGGILVGGTHHIYNQNQNHPQSHRVRWEEHSYHSSFKFSFDEEQNSLYQASLWSGSTNQQVWCRDCTNNSSVKNKLYARSPTGFAQSECNWWGDFLQLFFKPEPHFIAVDPDSTTNTDSEPIFPTLPLLTEPLPIKPAPESSTTPGKPVEV